MMILRDVSSAALEKMAVYRVSVNRSRAICLVNLNKSSVTYMYVVS